MANKISSIIQSTHGRLILSTALATIAMGGYGGRSAFAGSCTGAGGTYLCEYGANPLDTTQTLNTVGPLTVTTDSGFGIDTSGTGGDALNLSSGGKIEFTDGNSSTITGEYNGIYAHGTGSDSLSITTTGTVRATGTGINASAIKVLNESTGTDMTISAAEAIGEVYGIYAYHRGQGALNITATGSVTGNTGDGITTRNAAGTDMTISTADVTSNTYTAIYAENFGSGILSITANGLVTGSIGTGPSGFLGDGIFAQNRGTDLTISAGTVIAGVNGIDAINEGGGALSVTTTGSVTGNTEAGIAAKNSAAGSDLIIKAASVTGNLDGIFALNNGSGELKVTSSGLAKGGAPDDGILATNYGTDLTVSAVDSSGGYNGIFAINHGTGVLKVTSSGLATGGLRDGIQAFNSGTDLIISAVSAASTGYDGIFANNEGTGFLSITATGSLSGGVGAGPGGLTGDGIAAYNEGTSMTIMAAATSGGLRGVYAINKGTEFLKITTTGLAKGNSEYGIEARNEGTDLTIMAAAATGGLRGIYAINTGTGSLSVTATGTVTGIAQDGIDVRNDGSGLTSVAVSGVVTGGSGGVGIATSTAANQQTNITLNAGAAVSSGSGTAITNNEGDSTTLVKAGASVAGAISLGDGSDNLTFDGGDFSAVTLFDGGDDIGTLDGDVDVLTFSNVTGNVVAANVRNWETVSLETGSNILFGDGTLNTGSLDIGDGGTLLTRIFSDTFFDVLNVSGDLNFTEGGAIDFIFDVADFDLFDGLSLTFLTANSVTGFGDAIFKFSGLSTLFDASVQLNATSLSINFSEIDVNAVPLPPSLVLFGTGLLGMAGVAGLRRRRRKVAA